MSNRYSQVPLDYLEPIFEEWRLTYSLGDTLSVFFAPLGDHLFRALQFVDYMREKYSSDILLINMESDGIGPESLKAMLNENSSRDILILAKRLFMTPEAKYFESVLETWHAKTGQGLIILHEGFPIQLKTNISSSILTQKLLIHKLYPREAALKFVDAVAEQFGHNISQDIKSKIVDYCGGYPILLVDVLRRNALDSLFDDPVYNWKVNTIIERIPNTQNIETDLREMGLKDQNGRWIPAFENYIAKEKKQSLIVTQDKVLCNLIDLTREFSSGERKILSLLTQNKDKVVSRIELGDAFWGEGSSDYSDWALDAIVSRLRKKLGTLGVPLTITTYRGRGYGCA